MVEFNQNDNVFRFDVSNAELLHNRDVLSKVQGEGFLYLSTIKNLIDNGIGELVDNQFIVDIESMYGLDEIDRIALGFKSFDNLVLCIEHRGVLNKSDFVFTYDFRFNSREGELIEYKLNGPIIYCHSKAYLLAKNIYTAVEVMESFNNSVRQSAEDGFRTLAQLKKESNYGFIEFDQYLKQENVYLSPDIKLEIDSDSDGLSIVPVMDIPMENDFTSIFEKYPTVKSVYPLTSGGKRIGRTVLPPDQKSELIKVKNLNHVKDKDMINDIISNPGRYFDPEVIDISVFYSERVLEIGLYQPKYSTFISPYKSAWLPGVAVDMISEGELIVTIDTDEELADLDANIKKALNEKLDYVDIKGQRLPIDAAKSLSELGHVQIGNPKPVKTLNGYSVKQSKVLIIKENADELEFSQKKNGREYSIDESIVHKFFAIDNLAHGIELKDHQVEGVAWMQSLFLDEFGGCLLADDMGLGKTLQVLYFIEWLVAAKNIDKPIMIIAPVSLLENWEEEYDKFFMSKSLDLFRFYGTLNYNKRKIDKELISKLQQRQLVLTNYETLRSYQLSVCAVDFALVVLDEAQRIKTPGTLITTAAKALQADFKIAMTGTPVENSLIDLWCIMDFVFPGLLNTAKEFKKEFHDPMGKDGVDVVEMGERLRSRIGVLLKRRLKSDVAKDLPNKYLSNVDVNKSQFEDIKLVKIMPDTQLKKYMAEIKNMKNGTNDQILTYIQRIKAITDHPCLGDPNLLNYSSSDLILMSAKLQILIEVLDKIKNKEEKVIIFAERRDTQLMLQKIVNEIYSLYPSIINGDTPSQASKATIYRKSRQATIAEFSKTNGFNILILSPIAAGVGLNIVAANHVIHYSRHWNPAKEEQATDRAFRIGQTKPVYVYYPMAVCADFESFDIILDKLLSRKLSLATNTLYPTEQTEVIPSDIFNELINN